MPDVDLFVRTSGEQRTCNFLLWQSAYAEMVFLDTLWPDFDRRHLWHAFELYASRDRRYGDEMWIYPSVWRCTCGCRSCLRSRANRLGWLFCIGTRMGR